MSRVVTVNDKMHSGYRYELAAPSGRDFDPVFRPELTPKQMLELGVFCGKYLTDCGANFRQAGSRGRSLRLLAVIVC
jgi:hypothetical protein